MTHADNVPPSEQEQMAALRAAYPTPDDLITRMHRELDAMDAVIRAASPHWQAVQPGREWTPAQEVEHTIVINEGTGKLARLLLSDKDIRQPPEVPGEYQGGRRQAPASTIPAGDQTPEALLARNAATRDLLTVHAPANPGRTYYHPFMGQLDALDWLRMAAYQTRHHRLAVERGLKALAEQ
ncbi:DinB family protein [Deinococcus sp.]|uniref:DinB family protein n=1 Tax=Deinococcus sp. TaxID=47478 RepID=UPI00286985D9|nr:DinB family protein [Deinococcus sp.]